MSYQVEAQQIAKRDSNGIGYLEYLPPGYNDNTNLYPVIIFLHGSGERGDGSPGALEAVKKNGPPKHIKNGHNMCFEYNGVEECFIVLSPQTNRWSFPGYEFIPFVKNALETYRIDPDRVYLTGLSMGGQGTWEVAYSDENMPNVFAALSPAPGRGSYQNACIIAQNNVPVWAFHGSNDTAMPVHQGQSPINGMNLCDPDPAPIFTIYEGVGHSGAWNRAYRTDNSLHTPNLYQWFLAQRRGNQAPQSPTVNAIGDLIISLPDNNVELSATASDQDGDIISILWERVSGPNIPTTGALDQLNLSLDGLIEGSYNYKITVTDNDGLSASDQVIITVLAEPLNMPPAVDAGNNRVITLPTNSLTLSGSASDSDGSVESTLWAQVSGPNTAGIVSPNNLSTNISNLIEGSYTFSLTAVDNENTSVTDDVIVTVQPVPPNNPPSANAGADLEVSLPENSITITGSANDSDGTIASFSWTQSSGPNNATTSELNMAEIAISDLIQGAYVFTLIVTDDDGDTDSDQVTINVLPAPPNDPPNANAGANKTITLPQSAVNLEGSGTDTDGSIVSYLWTQQNGPNTANVGTPDSENTEVAGLIEGVYTFSLTVVDDDGDSNTDNAQVTVLPVPANEPPTVNAGTDQNLTLPTNYTTIAATATDTDGSVVSYMWDQISGPNIATSNTLSNAAVNISNLVEGIYQFSVTVTDNDGASASDLISIIVFPEQNDIPNANAGANISITLPTTMATLQGTGTDSDGSIAAYNWTQVTGPNTASIENPSQASTIVEGLIEGVYSFRLIVTDNDGASDTDQMTLTVLPEPINIPPTAEAGEDVFLTLPENNTILSGQGTDPDGTIVSYTWNVVDAGDLNIDDISDFEVQNLPISGLEVGIYTFGLTVVDDRGASANDQIRVFVNTPNLTPESNAGQDVTITLPQNFVALSGSATDPDGQVDFTLWEQVSGPNNASISNALNLNTSVTNLIEGIYIFNLYVVDNDGLSDSDEIRVTVNPAPPNIPPNVNAGTDIQVTLPVQEILLNGSATDNDGNITNRQWSQLGGPNTLTGSNLATDRPRFTGFIEGTYSFRLTATDNDGAQGSDDVRVVVLAAPGNQLPSVDAGANITITLPGTSTELNGSAFDVDGTVNLYDWTQVAGPNTATIIAANEPTTGLQGLIQGIYTFRLTVQDDQGGEAFDQVNVRVNPEPSNQPPIVVASNNLIINLPQTSSSLSATAEDVDGSIVSIEWTQRSGPGTATLSNTTSLNIGVEDLILGTYVFRITVMDNSGVTSFDEVNIRVLEALANQPPSVDAGTNQLIFAPNNTVMVNGTAEDTDGSVISTQWLQISGPNTATIASPGSYETTINNIVEGTYIFRLEATDNQGLTGFDQMSIRVNAKLPNLPPTTNAGENVLLVLPDNQATLSGTVKDSDGTIQSINWAQEFGPNSATLAGVNQLSLQVSDLIKGFYVFRLIATDNEGASDYDEVTVTVNEILPKQPPTVDAGVDQNIIIPQANVQLSGTATSGDGTIAAISWEQLSGPTEATISNQNEFQAVVSDLTVGTYVFRLVVKNSENLQNFDLISINVKANQAPYAFAGSDTTLTLPVNDFLAVGQGVDNDGTIEGVEWTQSEGPNTAQISNSTSNQTTMNNFVEGSYRFEFRVVDNKGAESFDILRVEVVSDRVNVAPSVNAGEDITIQLPDNSVELAGVAADTDGNIIQYKWEKIEGGEVVLITPDMPATVAENLTLGNYLFQLTVVDNGGLQALDRVNVVVIAPDENPFIAAELTKLFTPNGDGINDLWVSEDLDQFNNCSLTIYNKLGVKIFEDDTYQNNWDGSDQRGRIVEDGAYFYVISCENNFVKRGGVRVKK